MKDSLIKISIFFQVFDIKSKFKAMLILTKLILNLTQIFRTKMIKFVIQILKTNQKVLTMMKVLISKRVSLLFKIMYSYMSKTKDKILI